MKKYLGQLIELQNQKLVKLEAELRAAYAELYKYQDEGREFHCFEYGDIVSLYRRKYFVTSIDRSTHKITLEYQVQEKANG